MFPKNQIHPNFFHDILKVKESPLLAIEVISASQTIQEMLAKASLLVQNGVKTVWTVESHSQSVFVTTANQETLFHREVVESEGICVDFAKVF